MPTQYRAMARPVQRRVDEAAADVGTLADMGVVAEPPEPQAPAPPAGSPADPPAEVPPEQQVTNMAMLDSAFTEAGVAQTDTDTAAVRTLATLDTETVKTVAGWVKRGKRPETK